MPEEPEQVLPQHRRSVRGGVEEVGPEVTVGEQHRDRGGHHRQRDDQQHRVHEQAPHEQRQPAPAHPGGAHVHDRRVEVDRADQRGDAGDVDQEDPRVLAAAGRVLDARQRRVAPPAGLRRLPEQRDVEHDPAEQQQPVGERVQARERHVAGADHQRQEVVPEARHHRHHEQEDHRRAVEREQLVVVLAGQQRVVRHAELHAHQQRFDPAEREEHEGGDQVEDPDLLVVGGRDPVDPLLARPRPRHLVRGDLRNRSVDALAGGGLCGDGHPFLLRSFRRPRGFRWR